MYLWLIGLTLSGMTAHNLLDFWRKARRPSAPPRSTPVDQPERMNRAQRRQHGLVMIAFTTLVYTGFALKYPESWWAAPLLAWETRFALRGTIHRVAGLVLLATVVWHMTQLAVSPRQRARMRCMLPSRRDLTTLRGTLAYYVGLRSSAPHAGPTSYVEKVEYWAFMWGVALMSVTGFLLWFANATLRYLPNWMADVATAIHFYEAVLATLAILIWHLYWVIFDPDVYPMDAAWWTGRAPASRVLERRVEDAPRQDGET
jgi:cytochrome b subunit of formate dehydrogenase